MKFKILKAIKKLIGFLMAHIQAIIIILYGLVSVGLLIIALLNYGSAENYELLKPIAGGMFISLFFVVSSLFSPIEAKQYTVPVAILSRKDQFVSFPHLSIYDEPGYGYSNISTLVGLCRTREIEIVPIEGRQYLTELLELETLLWIASEYRQHWQVQREWFSGVSGGGGSSNVAPDADREKAQLSIAELLKDNLYAVKAEQIFIDKNIYLPKGTKATYDQELNFVEFENNHINMKIKFTNVGGSALGAGVVAEKLKAKLQEDVYGSIWVGHFTVKFTITPKRLRRWSPATKKQLAWANELATNYDKAFSFSILKQIIEEKL
ncbi:MAG: hypothetical protein JSW62_01615 [Thermoplasmatales archaeon]|nr:MAG: hypothetical protein JSW62_01615 [Thermoplasmatales archaeon]